MRHFTITHLMLLVFIAAFLSMTWKLGDYTVRIIFGMFTQAVQCIAFVALTVAAVRVCDVADRFAEKNGLDDRCGRSDNANRTDDTTCVAAGD